MKAVKMLMVLVLSFASCFAFAKYSEDDVRATMQTGSPAEVEAKLLDVLKERPNNSLAWYWYAQALERQERLPEARLALDKSASLLPTMSFADKDKLAKIKDRLSVFDRSPLTKQGLDKISAPLPLGVEEPSDFMISTLVLGSYAVLMFLIVQRRYRWEKKLAEEAANVAEK